MADEILNTEKLLLDAVNILLATIDELPIEDEADFDALIEARIARDTIFEVKRAVLGEGWDFNRDETYIFPLDVQGMIPVPSNVLDITAERGDVVMRDWKLYSRKNQSFIFDDEIKCDVIWDMAFNSLTQPLRHYITIRAARVYIARGIGDKTSVAYTKADEETALLSARRSETRTGQYNILGGSYGVNNVTRL